MSQVLRLKGHFSDALKHMEKKPLLNKGSRKDMGNYCPNYILQIFSKIFGKVVVMQILKKVSDNQYGFQKGNCTTETIIEFVKISALYKFRKVALSFCNLIKAFDCVIYHLLLYKMERYGIGGCALEWFRTYLRNRKQVGYIIKQEKLLL
ncbi:uncharacterized protein LOC126252680 [Schistocerca nitens]|uniref:uncharacterized protein LOC126252680 n=1 Tax=Schistocerca nitens TaxID=7011 RepID=UPI002118D0F6|nr:uncharacterized protein LOC126252680 [Schistocerca nitens]